MVVDNFRAENGEHSTEEGAITNITWQECCPPVEIGARSSGEIIYNRDFVAQSDVSVNDMGGDKTGAAGNQDAQARPSNSGGTLHGGGGAAGSKRPGSDELESMQRRQSEGKDQN